MGILRLYLALCVVAAHTGGVFPWLMHDGKQAVQIFYVISGFYMAMVLSSRYASLRDFYRSRFLRIFPTYWVVLTATAVGSIISGLVFKDWLLLTPYASHPLQHNGLIGLLLAAGSNLTLVGQDCIMFLSHEATQSFQFTSNFELDASPLWQYLLVPQCWSVSVELLFYSIVPFLNVIRSRWLVLITVCALAARLFTYKNLGLAHDPWDYRFFPFEISLFLFGMLGFRVYEQTKRFHASLQWRCSSTLLYIATSAVLLSILYAHARLLGYLNRFVGSEIGVLLSYPLWIPAIPLLFLFFGSRKDDRFIGELSYPVYLIHFIVKVTMLPLLAHLALSPLLGACSAILSVVLAFVLYVLLIVPLDKRRHLLVKAGAFSDTAKGEASPSAPVARSHIASNPRPVTIGAPKE